MFRMFRRQKYVDVRIFAMRETTFCIDDRIESHNRANKYWKYLGNRISLLKDGCSIGIFIILYCNKLSSLIASILLQSRV